MRRTLLLGAVMALGTAWACQRAVRVEPGRLAAPSLEALARAVVAPQGYVTRKAPAFFDRENLYKAIDGMAGEYISYGCMALAMLEWVKPGGDQEKLQAEVYDMGSPLGAFGIYSRAHVGEGEFSDVGEEAAVGEDAVEFARGQFYVRLMGPLDSRPALVNMARAIVARVPPGPRPEQLVARLPAAGRVPRSERWIPEAAFGMDFMRDVVAARYKVGERVVELYLASFADTTTAREASAKFRATAKARSPRATQERFPGFSYRDEYLGEVAVFQLQRHLVVLVGYDRSPAVETLLRNAELSASADTSGGDVSQRP